LFAVHSRGSSFLGFSEMNYTPHKRAWKILCWNVRGINSESKWDAIRSKIVESNCDVVCLQETKRESFDSQYVKNFCPLPWIALNLSHLLGHLEGVSLHGMVPNLWAL
jgi:hypothetical protein